MRAEGIGIWGYQVTDEELQEDIDEHGWNNELTTKVLCSSLILYCQDQECLEEVKRFERRVYMNNPTFKRELLMAREQKARKLHILVQEMDRWIQKQSVFGETTRRRGDRSYLLDNGGYADETEEETKERVLGLFPGLIERLSMADADTVDDSTMGAVGLMALWASGQISLERKERE